MIFAVLIFSILILLSGLPVAFGIGLIALITMAVLGDNINAAIIAQRALYGVDKFVLLAIPLFLLAGNIMNTGGVTKRLFGLSSALVGHLKGGLGHVNVVVSIIFAGMSGSAIADAAGLGVVEIKAMKEAGYDDDFSCAITAASSTIGPIIPPSIGLVVYGMLASESIGKLLIGGFIPGLIMGISLMILITYIARKRNLPCEERVGFKQFIIALKNGILPCFTPLIIIGGIVQGIFTPTEAAGVACLYAFLLGLFIYKELSFNDLFKILRKTAVDTAVITFIVACASIYSWIIIKSQIPALLVEKTTSITTNPWIILTILNIIILFMGCFMESMAILTIVVPVVMPLLKAVGIDPIHFGLIIILNTSIGLITPPFGIVLFVINKIHGISIPRLSKAIFPFYLPLIIVLILITYCPIIVTYLPNLFLK